MVTTTTNNPLIDIYNLIYNVISTYVTDVNTTRSGKTDPLERQWIFPEAPEEKDQFYPIVAIILNSISYEENGSGRLHTITKDTGLNTADVTEGNWAVMNIQISLFIKKKELYEILVPGEAIARNARNKLLTSFLINEISKQIDINRNFFITEKQADITVGDIGDVYEDDQTMWAVDLQLNVTMPNIWNREYTVGELIETINITENVDQTN